MRYGLFILTFIFGICGLKSSAQEKGTIGFIVTQEMDTLYGTVERTSKLFGAGKNNSLFFLHCI